MAWNAKSVFGGGSPPAGMVPKPPSPASMLRMAGGAPYMDFGTHGGLHESINPLTGMGRLKNAPLKQREAVMAKLRGPKI